MYKFAVIIPTLTKENAILDTEVYVYNIQDITFHTNNPKKPKSVTLIGYTNISTATKYDDEFTVSGAVYAGNSVLKHTPVDDGFSKVIVFENKVDAIQWKIDSVKVACEEASNNIISQFQRIKEIKADVDKEHNKIKEDYPEYLL